jgi:hypothetical protein
MTINGGCHIASKRLEMGFLTALLEALKRTTLFDDAT